VGIMTSTFLTKLGKRCKTANPLAKSTSKWISGLLQNARGGGLRFVDDEDAFRLLLRDAGRTPSRTLDQYVEEVIDDDALRLTFERVAAQRKLTKYRDWRHRVTYNKAVIALGYSLVREFKPDLIVETGTATGSNTSVLLSALERNGRGRLISIDLPPQADKLTMEITLVESEVGYFIPEEFKHRWSYRKGDAKLLLPPLLAEEKVDIFIHDSLHTTTHMAFEYEVARALTAPGTLILSDDILWNDSFDSFARLHRLKAYAGVNNANFGGVINSFSAEELEIGVGIIRL
jgi:cephalosporin hydroxylase